MTETIVDTIFDRAEDHPDHPALVRPSGPSLSYGDLRDSVRREAADLETDLSLPEGARCGLITDDQVSFLVKALAVLEVGYCLLPVPEDYAGEELSEFRNRTKLHALIDGRESLGTTVYESPGALDEANDETYRSLDPAYVRFTSGTTGRRKGVLLGHRSLLERTRAVNKSLDVSRNDRVLWLLDMRNHFVSSVLLYLRNGATLLFPENHLPTTVSQCVEDEAATFLYGTPYHYEMLLGASGADLGSVRLAISTASGLSETTAKDFYETFGVPLTQALGVIEAGIPIVNRDAAETKPLSLGQVQPEYDVKLKTPDGLESAAPAVGPGEVMIEGPGMFDAYLSPWVPADEVVEEGYFPTGDQGYFDDDGDFFLEGRRNNRINMAGMKFFCEEVEAVLNRHSAVEESRVLPEDHEKLGEVPVAEIVVNESPDADALKAHCREDLASHMVPRTFREVDSIPRTDTGKIKRH